MSNAYIAKNAYAFIRDLLKIYKPYFEAHFAKISQNLGGSTLPLRSSKPKEKFNKSRTMSPKFEFQQKNPSFSKHMVLHGLLTEKLSKKACSNYSWIKQSLMKPVSDILTYTEFKKSKTGSFDSDHNENNASGCEPWKVYSRLFPPHKVSRRCWKGMKWKK